MAAGVLTRSDEGGTAVLRLPAGPWARRDVLRLDSLLAELGEEGGVRSLLLEAGGDDFCPGCEGGASAAVEGTDSPSRLAGLPYPVLAAVNGTCRSAGLALALAADFRIASTGATFALDDLAGGAFPPWGAIQRLSRVVGPGVAGRMVLLGSEVTGEEALRLGLVHEVASAPGARARELAGLLATRGPLALEYAKEAVWRGRELPLHHALRLEGDFNHLLQGSRDRAEGLAAFFEKRDADFEGR